MKKIYIAVLLLTFIKYCYSQTNELNFNFQRIDFSAAPRTAINPMSIKLWDSYNNGGPTSYGTVLELYGLGGHQTSQLNFGGWDNSKIRYREAFYNQNTWSEWITLLDSKNDIESQGNLKISGTGNHFIYNGNVGIGTISPQTKLHILADDKLGKTVGDYTPLTRLQGNAFENSILINDFILRESTGDNWQSASYIRGLSIDVSFLNPKTLRSWIKQNPVSERVEFGSSDNTFMSVGSNVGIGTTNPDEKLTVNGVIHAKEVKVDLNVPLADFVFKPNYKLMSLPQVEQFVKANNHLPQMPSAEEVSKNGLSMGEMQNKLLQKVEELTLYAIEMKKEINALKDENKRIKTQLDRK